MSKRILIAGIGNIFLGDDGFGVEVVRRLAERQIPEGVEVRDFGIRGLDLAYALHEERDAIIFVDALPGGEKPGTLSVIEAQIEDEGEVALDTHGMDPVKVIRLARAMGAELPRTLVVGCEPQNVLDGEAYDDMLIELSKPVQAAVGEAVKLVESLVKELREEKESASAEKRLACRLHPGDTGEDAGSGGGPPKVDS